MQTTAPARIVQATWMPDRTAVGGMVLRTVPGQPRAVLARHIGRRRPAAPLPLSAVLGRIAEALT